MKRILFCCVLALLVSVSCVHCAVRPIAQRIADMKRDLNQEFGFPDDRNMFVVTVTRTPMTSSGAVPLISHHEFEQVLKLLYASTVGDDRGFAYSVGEPRVELNRQVDGDLDTGGGIPTEEIEGVNSTVRNISRYFDDNRMANASKLVVFNEMFFSQMRPLEASQKDFIERKLFDVSRISPATVFYPNFLYKEVRMVPGTTVYSDLYRMIRSTDEGIGTMNLIRPGLLPLDITPAPVLSMVFSDITYVLSGCTENIVTAVNINDALVNWPYLVNETHAVHNGEVLTRYRKVGYFMESDFEICRGTLYDCGVGYDEGVVPNTLCDKLLRNVSIDVCLDLNLGIRRRSVYRWQNPVATDVRDSSLHLVQSNSIDPFCDLTNRGNLPRDTGIVHADKYPHPSWIPPAVNRPQSVYLPYIDTSGNLRDFGVDKVEFHVRFLGSDYAFSFLKL